MIATTVRSVVPFRAPSGLFVRGACLLVAIGGGACAGAEPQSARADGGSDGEEIGGRDAAVGHPVDAAGLDGGPSINEGDDRADACWNGLDDDANGAIDCDDPACGANPYCCLGVATTRCCAAPSLAVALDFTSCEQLDPASCGAGIAFGAPAPLMEGGAFVPNGAVADSGLVLDGAIDGTSARVVMSARLAATPDSCHDCLDAIAFGLGEAPAEELVSLLPDVAVLVRPARDDFALVIAGEVVLSEALADGDDHIYTLALSPDGTVELTVDGAPSMRASWIPQPDRRVLLYGRTHNRPAGAPPPARALDVQIEIGQCEIPSALRRAPAALVTTEGALEARAPSVAVHDDGSLRVAFEREGAVYIAREEGGTLTGALSNPAIRPEPGETLRDPELVRAGDRVHLYVTRVREGRAQLARAEGDADLMAFGPLSDLVSPEGALSLSAPSVARVNTIEVVAAVADVAGEPRLVLMRAIEGRLEWLHGDLEASTVVRPRGGVHAFDAHEVGGPALDVDAAGIVRLYYAGRRGTRWSIGLTASPDLRTWRYAPDAPVLSGSSTGYDAAGVRDPSVVRVGGERHLYHTASDGTSSRLARASGASRW